MRLLIYIFIFFPLTISAQVIKPYKATQEVLERYPVDSPLLIKNAWLPNGQQIIKDGNGYRIYDVGQIRKYQYKNGDANGEVLFLDSIQKIVFTKGYCKNGQPDSTWTEFYETGKIKATYSYNKGKIQGEYKTYFDNGQIKSIGLYKSNCPDGEWLTYLPDGRLDKKTYYENCKKLN